MDKCDKNACPRCKACTRDFIRVINLEDIGFVVYKYTKKAKDMQKDIGVTLNSVKVDDEMYVILSTKDTDVNSENFIPNTEHISCPRCRQFMDQSLKHIQNVTAAQKNTITGVCKHCKLKAQAQSRCDCKELIKCFIRKYDLNKWNNELLDGLETEINKEHTYAHTTFLREKPASHPRIDQSRYQDYTKQELELGSSNILKDADRFKIYPKGDINHQDDEVLKSMYPSGFKTDSKTNRQELEQGSLNTFKDADRFKISPKGDINHQDDEVLKSMYPSGFKTHSKTNRQELEQGSLSTFKDADRFKVSHKGKKLHQDDEVGKSKYSSGIKTNGKTNRIIKEQKETVSPKTVKKKYSSEANKDFNTKSPNTKTEKHMAVADKTLTSKTKYTKDNKETDKKEIKKKDGKISEKILSTKEVKLTDKNKHEKDEKQGRELKTKQIASKLTDENVNKNQKRKLKLGKSESTVINKKMMLEAQRENIISKKKTLQDIAEKKDEISISKIKMLKNSQDNVVVLSNININSPDTIENPLNIIPDLTMDSKFINHSKWHRTWRDPYCVYCIRCSLEDKMPLKLTDIDSISDASTKTTTIHEIIVGEKLARRKSAFNDESLEVDKDVKPILFENNFTGFTSPYNEKINVLPDETTPVPLTQTSGVVRYALSNRSFIDNGWTVLPTEKIVRKLKVYRMHPAQPEYNWFEQNKSKGPMLYNSGEKLAEFDDKGRGRWFYKNGRLALDYYDAEELNANQRFVIFSNGEPDERGRPRPYTVLATFDYLGNGIVFDHSGKIRLKYNQTEGVVLDKNIGPFSRWKWHMLNDPPEFRKVVQDTVINKDPRIEAMSQNYLNVERVDDEMILEIELNNLLKEKTVKRTQTYKPFQIRMKALKINEQFSLKVLDQATVYLIFRDGTTNLKLNIGMILDNKEIVDIDMTAEVEEVSNNVEILPARTDSILQIQKHVENARRFERNRKKRDKKLFIASPSMSADKLTAATSRPIQYPLRTVRSCVTATETADCCY